MTVTINGDNVEETNQIEVKQNAADDESMLTCVPECPQEDYEYDYQVSSIYRFSCFETVRGIQYCYSALHLLLILLRKIAI